MRSDPVRLLASVLAAALLLAALTLALFDSLVALLLIAALGIGWLLVLVYAIGESLYRSRGAPVLVGAAVLALALLFLLRAAGDDDGNAPEPMPVSGYGAEIWPNRLAGPDAFILRERVEIGGGDGSDGRANPEPVSTGPLMREIRFVPGAGAGVPAIRLIEQGEATIVVNPIEGGLVHHARGGSVSRVELPIGPVVRIHMDELPAEARIAWLVGAGHALAPIASLVMPLRRMPRALAIALFAIAGALAALAWSDRIIEPLRRRFIDRSKSAPPARPGRPGGPIERAPLVPRRK